MISNIFKRLHFYILAILAVIFATVTIYAIANRDESKYTSDFHDHTGQSDKVKTGPIADNWLIYQNAELGFRIRYPLGYTAQPQGKAINFELEYLPKSTPIFFVHFNPDPPNPNRSNVTIEVWTNPSYLSLQEWLQQSFPGIKEESEVQTRNIGGLDGVQWIGGENGLFINTLLPRGNKIYWIRLRLPNKQRNAEFENIYNAMIQTFARNE